MPLNLITDRWIPACQGGDQVTLRPDEIARAGVSSLAWPRSDLDLACLELLVGLLFLADPPSNDEDWRERYNTPSPERLRERLAPFASHFEMTGDGPRFLQDLECIEEEDGERANPPDMLFIDSAGANGIQNNTDLMVKRNRYPALPLPLAAMALYTLQAFAPSGGMGHRVSMRGGGPMVTLMQPLDRGEHALWRLVWANVPEGEPLLPTECPAALPWLRPTRTSENDQSVTPESSHRAEAFFGMPRRLRLLFDEDEGTVTGVVQKTYGTCYQLWQHPLSPHYRMKPGAELLPVHPKPGMVSYHNWLGMAFGKNDETRIPAESVCRFHAMANPPDAEICAGGWSTKNMKPRDFALHVYPTFRLDEEAEFRVIGLVEAANKAAGKLMSVLETAVKMRGQAADAVREAFFGGTETEFVVATRSIAGGAQERTIEENWLNTLRRVALELFDQRTVPAMLDGSLSGIKNAVQAHQNLLAFFAKPTIRDILGLTDREKKNAA